MASITAIRFVHFEDLGTFGALFTERGFEVEYVDAASGDSGKVASPDSDLVVVLGGPIGAYDDDDYPMLRPILAMLKRRIAAELPTLGICLGAQLIARAAGARVYTGHGKEIGWAPIKLTEAGRQSPLRHLSSTPVLHWHGDTFDLPRGAALLASSEMYAHQAFALGANVLGLQFHPEVTKENLESWYIGHACEIGAAPGVKVRTLRRDANSYADMIARTAADFVRQWLEDVFTPGVAAAAD